MSLADCRTLIEYLTSYNREWHSDAPNATQIKQIVTHFRTSVALPDRVGKTPLEDMFERGLDDLARELLTQHPHLWNTTNAAGQPVWHSMVCADVYPPDHRSLSLFKTLLDTVKPNIQGDYPIHVVARDWVVASDSKKGAFREAFNVLINSVDDFWTANAHGTTVLDILLPRLDDLFDSEEAQLLRSVHENKLLAQVVNSGQRGVSRKM